MEPIIDHIQITVKDMNVAIPFYDRPRLFPEHGPDYYAVFFKDLEGIKYEVVCTGPGGSPPGSLPSL